ncbi:MAG: TIR domain-containing protein [Sphingomicrobium sp.]
MGQIFLSYAREDRGTAQTLARVLEQAGHEVWWDRHLDSGEEFADQIEAALNRAEVVLVAWSRGSVKSRWVRDEAAAGGDTGRLIPVSIDGSMPPMGFRQFHTMDLAGWKGSKRDERTAELLESIDRRLNGKADTPPVHSRKLKTGSSEPHRSQVVAAAAIALVIAAAGLWMFVGTPFGRSESKAPTIAIAPFTATSSDGAVRDLAIQSRDSVAHALSQSGLPVKLIDAAAPNSGKPPADYILSAELSDQPDKILATVRMDDAAQHATVWSRQIDEDRKNAADLPDRIGAQVAGSLSWSGTIKFIRPGDADFTAKLLQIDIIRDPLENYQNAARLASQAPKSGTVQLALAMYTAFALGELPQDQRAQAVAAGRQAAERAKSLMPHFGDVYLPSCVLYPPVRMAQCEDQLRAGLKADPDAPFVNEFLSYLLNDVGRNDEAGNRADLAYQHDPYMPAKIGQVVHMLEVAGASREADPIYANGVRWWPQWGFFRQRISGIVERGDFDSLRHVEQEPGARDYGPSHPDSIALVAAVRARSVPQLKRTCADARGLYSAMCMLAFAKLGDLDSAYAIADQLYPRQLGRTPAETEQTWIKDPGDDPVEFITSAAAEPMRRDPRFMPLAERTGLIAYWRTGRPPDFCRQNPEPVCRVILKRG